MKALVLAMAMAGWTAMAGDAVATATLDKAGGEHVKITSVDVGRETLRIVRYESKAIADAGTTEFQRAVEEVVQCPGLTAELAKPADAKLSIAENVLKAATAALKAQDARFATHNATVTAPVAAEK